MREWHLLVETTRSLVVLLFVIDPISILAHPHCTTVGKLWKSLVVIHSQKILLKAAWLAFPSRYEHLVLAKRLTSTLHMVLFNIDWRFNGNRCIILLVINISNYITDWGHLILLISMFYDTIVYLKLDIIEKSQNMYFKLLSTMTNSSNFSLLIYNSFGPHLHH